MTRIVVALLSGCLAGCATSRGASPPPPVISGSTAVTVRAATPGGETADPAEVRALEKTLRELLLKNLPTPVVQSAQDWGRQEEVVRGRLRGNPVKQARNDGHWRRFTVTAINPAQTLALGITEATFPEPGRAAFTAMLGVDCALRFEQQLWRNGRRFYSGETRGRCHAALLLKCEVTSRTETKPGQLLPDLVFRMRVTDAQLFYEKLVIDHTAGVGGDAAKALGGAIIDVVKRVKPELERDLLNKANAAVVKAADTKDVRVSIDTLFKGGSLTGRR